MSGEHRCELPWFTPYAHGPLQPGTIHMSELELVNLKLRVEAILHDAYTDWAHENGIRIPQGGSNHPATRLARQQRDIRKGIEQVGATLETVGNAFNDLFRRTQQ